MDAFEAQQQFEKHLRRLNSSSKSVEIVIKFYNRHSDVCDYLLEQILTTIGQDKLNTRIIVALFIKDLCTECWGNSPELRQWLPKNILRIVDKCVPISTLGEAALVNIQPLKALTTELEASKYISTETRNDIDALLHEKLVTKLPEKVEPVSRDEILKRMEEDRERTKKVKERKWVVDNSDAEFEFYWNHLGGLAAIDKENMDQQNKIAKVSRNEL